VSQALTRLRLGLGPAQAVILGTITGIGGGMLRDVLLREVPAVLRSELYAVPAIAGATVVAIAHQSGTANGAYAVLGAAVCLIIRLLGMRYQLNIPIAPSERHEREKGNDV
jgi:uncharacterized membrane protein YeiH